MIDEDNSGTAGKSGTPATKASDPSDHQAVTTTVVPESRFSKKENK